MNKQLASFFKEKVYEALGGPIVDGRSLFFSIGGQGENPSWFWAWSGRDGKTYRKEIDYREAELEWESYLLDLCGELGWIIDSLYFSKDTWKTIIEYEDGGTTFIHTAKTRLESLALAMMSIPDKKCSNEFNKLLEDLKERFKSPPVLERKKDHGLTAFNPSIAGREILEPIWESYLLDICEKNNWNVDFLPPFERSSERCKVFVNSQYEAVAPTRFEALAYAMLSAPHMK